MKRFLRALVICFAPYFAFVAYLIWRGSQFIAGLPRWVWWVGLSYFLVALVIVGLTTMRRKTVAPVTRKTEVSGTSSRTLKGALILYIVIFLNGAGLTLSGRIPFTFAVPGLAVDALLIALFLWLLNRQRKAEKGENNSSMVRE